ncbi:ATP-binding cassette domain-containing protein [Sneathiella sp.]|uniref:ATP-binding cassette domain-containing protein n=1 Tax=Sneathiella sp. TaxID=1964365 RepID=UPI003561EA4F
MVGSILPLLLENVTVSKDGIQIIGPLSLRLEGRGCTVLVGPNGAGKTTLLRLMHGLDRARQGKVKWAADQTEVYSSQSFVFQTPVVLRRSVRENIAYPLLVRKVPRKAALAEADRWIDDIGLASAGYKQADVLSGGEKQKLAIARALISTPDVLFLDEPSANLDGASTRDIETLIERASNDGTRVVMATHDLGQARRLASEVLFMYHGVIHEQTTGDTFFTSPQTIEAQKFIRGDILL